MEIRPAEALETALILQNVFERLGIGDLKNCRNVCQIWHAQATTEMEKRKIHIKLRLARSLCCVFTKSYEDFGLFFEANQRLQSRLPKMKFENFELNCSADAAYEDFLKSDWAAHIVSLRLKCLRPQEFSGLIWYVLQRMKQLKNLTVILVNEMSDIFDYNHDLQAPKGSLEGAVFSLQALTVREYHHELLNEADSTFLKHCPNLKNIRLHYVCNSTNPLKWLEDFKNPKYPRAIHTVSLINRYFVSQPRREDAPVSNFLSLFPKLEVLCLDLTLEWDTIQILCALKNVKIKQLAINLTLRSEVSLEKSSVSQIYHALKSPQFSTLESLKVSIACSEIATSTTVVSGPGLAFHNFQHHTLPSMKNLSITFGSSSPQAAIQAAIIETLRMATFVMPAVESLNIDGVTVEAVRKLIKLTGNFAELKCLTLYAGDKPGTIRDDTLFGLWFNSESQPINASRGLLSMKRLEKLKIIMPSSLDLSNAAFTFGFMKMARLRNLKFIQTLEPWDGRVPKNLNDFLSFVSIVIVTAKYEKISSKRIGVSKYYPDLC